MVAVGPRDRAFRLHRGRARGDPMGRPRPEFPVAERETVMSSTALTSMEIMDKSVESAKSGVMPAIIGALGAAIGLNALAPLFATFSVPISVLGIVLGIRNRNWEALCVGGLAIACALVAMLSSEFFWVIFGVIGSALS